MILLAAVSLATVAHAEDPAVGPSIDTVVGTLTPELLVQVWGTAWDQDLNELADPASYGDPEDDPGFKLRRARAGFEGASALPSWGTVTYGVVFGYSSGFDGFSGDPGIDVVDAYGGWRPHRHFGVTAGITKVPFGREALQGAADLTFTDRTVLSNHIGYDRELGVVADGGAYGLRVRMGAFNGNGSLAGDDNAGMLLAARVEYGWGSGTAGTWGEVDRFSGSLAVNGSTNQDLAVREVAGGADVLLRVRGLALQAEGAVQQVTPSAESVAEPGVLETVTRVGAYGQLGYSWGVLEPAVRVELWNDDTLREDNGDLLIATAGLTTHLADDHVRVGAAYVARVERGGAAYANDTVRATMQLAW